MEWKLCRFPLINSNKYEQIHQLTVMLQTVLSLEGDVITRNGAVSRCQSAQVLCPANFYMCEITDTSQTKVPPRFELGSQDSES